ncbi:MAG: hypothetical protein OEX15_05125, partial [Gammaproteobacteria bacterium]|nr:hypothetical protein [Gammaproteobacteria bacterium]
MSAAGHGLVVHHLETSRSQRDKTTRPMPFFAKPIARGLCEKMQTTLIDPNVQNSLDCIEGHL